MGTVTGRVLLWLVLAVNVGAELFPFRLDPPRYRRNEVTRGSHTVAFGGHNVLRSRGVPEWLHEVMASGRVSVDLTAMPSERVQGGPARILSLSESPYRANVMIGQEGADLLVRVLRPGSEPWGDPAFVVPGALASHGWTEISVELEPGRIRISVDDEERLTSSLPTGYSRMWSASSRLALGDESSGGRPWRGELSRASVTSGGRVHDLLAPGALDQPDGSWLVPERLRRPLVLDLGEIGVGVLHFVAFLPLGYLLTSRSKARHPRRMAVFVCALFSLLILGAKTVIAGRHPNVLDVVTQVSGAGFGALLMRRAPSPRADRPPAR